MLILESSLPLSKDRHTFGGQLLIATASGHLSGRGAWGCNRSRIHGTQVKYTTVRAKICISTPHTSSSYLDF